MKVTDLKAQADLPFLLNGMGLVGLGVEIGVQDGVSCLNLLQNWWGKKLYLVDGWRHISGQVDISNVSPEAHLSCMANTFMRVYQYQERAVLIRDLSVDAAALFADESLDFVFIDADHSYGGCMADLRAWYPKVKKGGVFSGHDYCDSTKENNGHTDFGVMSAVDDFCDAHGLPVHFTTEATLIGKIEVPMGMWITQK